MLSVRESVSVRGYAFVIAVRDYADDCANG